MTLEQRQRLVDAIDRLGHILAEGEVLFSIASVQELEALATICDDAQMPREAARVRRWIHEVSRERWFAALGQRAR